MALRRGGKSLIEWLKEILLEYNESLNFKEILQQDPCAQCLNTQNAMQFLNNV